MPDQNQNQFATNLVGWVEPKTQSKAFVSAKISDPNVSDRPQEKCSQVPAEQEHLEMNRDTKYSFQKLKLPK